MGRILLQALLAIVLIGFISCKPAFEKIRTSGDSKLIYEKANAYYEDEEWYKAQQLFEMLINSYRGKVKAEEVYFKYAYTHYNLDQFILAKYYFKSFAKTFPNSVNREEADFMQAHAMFQQSSDYRLEQQSTAEAIDLFQQFTDTYPKSDRVKKCNQLIVELRSKLEKKAFEEGYLYYKMGDYQAATISFENLLKDFPESKDVERVRFLIVKGNYELSRKSIIGKQRERYENALVYAKLFKHKYSKSKYLAQVNTMMKNTLKKINKLKKNGY